MKKTAVVVVHGVGDPLPGDAMESLVQGLSAWGWREVASRRIEHVPEPATSATLSPLVQTFPVSSTAIRQEATGNELHLREVYWGDLSRVRGSVVALLLALFDLIFGLRHFVGAAADDATRQTQGNGRLVRLGVALTRGCCEFALSVVRGPMVAFNLLAAITCLFYVMARPLHTTSAQDALLASVAGAIVLAWAAWLLHRHASHLQWSPQTGRSLGIAGIAGLVLALWAVWWLPPFSIQAVVERITSAMSVGAAMMGTAAVLAMLMCLGTLCLHQRFQLQSALQRAMTVMLFCTTFSIGLFTFFVILGWLALIELLKDGFGNSYRAHALADRIDCGIHLFPMVALTFIVVGVCYLVIHWTNRSHMRHRYIVSPLVISVFLAMTCVTGVIFVFMINILESVGGCQLPVPEAMDRPIDQWVVRIVSWLEAGKALFIGAGVALPALLVANRAHLLSALDLVLDVLAHFRVDETDPAPRAVRRQWERTLARFRLVVEQTLRDTGAERLIVVSHSQGTTISLQGLGMLVVQDDPWQPAVKRPNLELGLITMGCPLDHLYRHYFPARYALRADADARADWWHNIHRADDFIGTDVQGLGNGYPVNTSVGPRGHTDYWRDAEVLVHIVGRLDGAAPPPKPADPQSGGPLSSTPLPSGSVT
ncbi:MAG: hypothetical protein IBJ14_00190 [Hydrogenophaga sp.]|nr:hypothetical protein [Hydrogenophaga sp.]